ncbi:MAG: MSMEG_3727 family PQQ-associated protein [Armatimonadota bacterium]
MGRRQLVRYVLAVLVATVLLLTPGNEAHSQREYVRLLRPKTLKQLSVNMVELVNELPRLDKQNEAIVGRLFAHGGLDKAERGKDGVWRAKIRVEPASFLWKPAIIMMREEGELELEFSNKDPYTHHAAYLPSNGDQVVLTFAPGQRGRARIRLDGPGLYWFGCPISNHAGRGMLGLILVSGEVPAEAKLDRPKQKRP